MFKQHEKVTRKQPPNREQATISSSRSSIFKKIKKFLKTDQSTEESLGLVKSYRIEALDPYHRPAEFLTQRFNEWKTSDTSVNFFQWLGYDEIDRQIKYCTEEEVKQYQYQIKDGQLLNQNNEPLSTRNFPGKQVGYALFVIDMDNRLFCHSYKKDFFHHSSFTSGKPVRTAGMLKTNANGKIKVIDNRSGHYQPSLPALYRAVMSIDHNAFSPDAKVIYQQQKFPYLTKSLTESNYTLLRLIGRGLDRWMVKIALPVEAFKDWARDELGDSCNKIQPIAIKSFNLTRNYEPVISPDITAPIPVPGYNDRQYKHTLFKPLPTKVASTVTSQPGVEFTQTNSHRNSLNH